ncbi:MAG: hypothetical protein ACM3ZO_04135 [Clostridia bacterium]
MRAAKRHPVHCPSAMICLCLAAVLVLSPGKAAAQSTADATTLPTLQVGGEWQTGVYAAQMEGSWSTSVESMLRLRLRLGDGDWRLYADAGATLGRAPGGGGDWTLTAELERAYLKVFLPWADLNLGRQEISWGVGYAWSPTDIFNPPNARDLGGLRQGVVAAVVRIPTGPLAYLSLVVARDRPISAGGNPDKWRYGARYHGNVGGTDWSLAALRDTDTTMVGADAKGDLMIGDLALGWHAEVAHHAPQDGSGPRLEGVLGADHSWSGGKIVWAGEYFYNSRGAETRESYDYVSWLAGNRDYLARHYAFTQLAYQHDEFTSVSGSVLANLVDRSAAVTAGATILLSDGWTLSLSATALSGSPGDEFAGGAIPGAPSSKPDVMLRAWTTYNF